MAWLQALAGTQTSLGCLRGQSCRIYILVTLSVQVVKSIPFSVCHIDSHFPTTRANTSISSQVGNPEAGLVNVQAQKSQASKSMMTSGNVFLSWESRGLHPTWAFSDPSKQGKELQPWPYPLTLLPSTQSSVFPSPDLCTRKTVEFLVSILCGVPRLQFVGTNRTFLAYGKCFVNMDSPSTYSLRTTLWAPMYY